MLPQGELKTEVYTYKEKYRMECDHVQNDMHRNFIYWNSYIIHSHNTVISLEYMQHFYAVDFNEIKD